MIMRNPDTVHPPLGGAYYHQADIVGPHRWLIVSGQVGRSLDGQVPTDPLAQVEMALDNLGRNLEYAGLESRDLVKLTWYLVGEIDPVRRREIAASWLGGHQPCSTLVYVAALAAPEYRVEIEAWACRALEAQQ
jgi:2-iminobutanoate/2-iminopropanoate deaminase